MVEARAVVVVVVVEAGGAVVVVGVVVYSPRAKLTGAVAVVSLAARKQMS